MDSFFTNVFLNGQPIPTRNLWDKGDDGFETLTCFRENADDTAFALYKGITKAEKQETIVRFAELYCNHISKKCNNPVDRLDEFHDVILEKTRANSFFSPEAFMSAWEFNYERYLAQKPKYGEGIFREFERFSKSAPWWAFRCVDVKDHTQRMMLVEKVFELIRDKDGDQESDMSLYLAVRDLCRTFRPGGARSVADTAEEMAKADLLI